MCVRACVCVCECVHACVCVCACACVCECMCACVRVCVCTCPPPVRYGYHSLLGMKLRPTGLAVCSNVVPTDTHKLRAERGASRANVYHRRSEVTKGSILKSSKVTIRAGQQAAGRTGC